MSRISGYSQLSGVAPGDLLPVVDVSDTSMAASGTTKRLTVGELAGLLNGALVTNPAYAGGADPLGSAVADSAFAAATSDAQTTGKPLIIPPGTYRLNSTLDWRIAGLSVLAPGGRQATQLIQYTSNTPVVRVAGQHQYIAGLTLGYPSQEPSANTGSVGIAFGDNTVGSSFESVYERLYIKLAQTAMAVDSACTTKGGLFSCSLRDIHINGCSSAGIDLRAAAGTGAANCTGCVFDNIYLHNNFSGSDANFAFRPVNLQGWDEVEFRQLNVEHTQVFSSDVVTFSQTGMALIDGLHIEHIEQSGNPGFGLLLIGSGTGVVQVRAMTVRLSTFTGTSYNSIGRFSSTATGAALKISGFRELASDGGFNATTYWADWGGSNNNKMTVELTVTPQVSANQVNAGTGDVITVT